MTVLWGARRGDVQYNSRRYWMTRIPFGSVVLEVDSSAYFSPGDAIVIEPRTGGPRYETVAGVEPGRVGLVA